MRPGTLLAAIDPAVTKDGYWHVNTDDIAAGLIGLGLNPDSMLRWPCSSCEGHDDRCPMCDGVGTVEVARLTVVTLDELALLRALRVGRRHATDPRFKPSQKSEWWEGYNAYRDDLDRHADLP